MRFDNIIILPATFAGFSPNRWTTDALFEMPGSTIASGTPSLQQEATPQSIGTYPGGSHAAVNSAALKEHIFEDATDSVSIPDRCHTTYIRVKF